MARFLARDGLSANWHDASPSAEDLTLVDSLGFARGNLHTPYRTVIAAPGVPIDHPDLQALRQRGAEVIGEVELAFRSRRTPIIGVTGTAGKGGTSSLITQLLCALGFDAQLGGNFDPPLLDVIGAEVAVAELSSFQLERVDRFRPEIAVITNLGVDHLDRHGSVGAYHEAKKNITRAQDVHDTLIVPQGLTLTSRAQVRYFSAHTVSLSGGKQVLAPAELPEGHHPANAAAAVLAVEAFLKRRGLPVPVADLKGALLAAQPVAGRFETVARLGGLRFIDDSIATRTLAVQAALERAPAPVVWLVGGRDKGADLRALEEVVARKVQHIVAFGEDGPKFAAHFGKPTTTVRAQNGTEVMREAVQAATQVIEGGEGSVLLAPIGTSFDLYTDYKVRGKAFAEAARDWTRNVVPQGLHAQQNGQTVEEQR